MYAQLESFEFDQLPDGTEHLAPESPNVTRIIGEKLTDMNELFDTVE